jgi:hypothetical protein
MVDSAERGVPIEILSSFSRERTRVEFCAGRDYLLGSSSENEIVLSGAGIAARHARFRLSGAALSVEPVGNASIAVNGLSIDASTAVGDGDWLLLGQAPFQLRLPAGNSVAPAGTAETLPQGPRGSTVLTIGRLPECDFTLPLYVYLVCSSYMFMGS